MARAEADEFEALKADLAQLRADISSLTEDLKKAGGAAASAAKRKAREQAEHLRDGAADAFEELSERGSEAMRAATDRIERQPLLAVLIALVIGVILGRLLDRR
jgi:ElaB/YqjD/DUF883 family membrane-anchored ribosome-binding protein